MNPATVGQAGLYAALKQAAAHQGAQSPQGQREDSRQGEREEGGEDVGGGSYVPPPPPVKPGRDHGPWA